MKRTYLYICLFAAASMFASCKKFLDEKPDKKLMVPTKIEDFQALLDNPIEMNLYSVLSGILSSDDYYQTSSDYNKLKDYEQNLYTWSKNSIPDMGPNDWATTYAQVYYANISLEGLAKIDRTGMNAAKWDNVKGSALLFRGRAFLEATTLWTRGYDNASATTDYGIPLTQTSDFNVKTTRPNLKETYEQIIKDLKASVPLLPAVPINNMRPSKPAAYGYLSRAYLSMRDYVNAGKYADSALRINSALTDYAPLQYIELYENPEIVMMFVADSMIDFKISEDFYDTYSANDNRKYLYFGENRDGTFYYSNVEQYTGYFTGIANDELYLTRAECFARAGSATDAMKDLNTLLKKRISPFTDLTATDAKAALKVILTERRKELLMRGTRWMDLKRLNKEPEFQETLTREAKGVTYTLPPNDPRYALPIPNKIVELAGIPQNIR
ncbi:RagB/SusD family nutrient uptake outer membrane protein [Pedobacter hiemivivus]|uniref:RagB/SusD family nutrient uptake outer membrane protein n=1 Tax=Pedobacter hiemivivus TaxID=2530454 RepID=A0A4R0N842_9SPHI|nr:RagB/SusD family nutrient uptake outer membrane protein [Pedobacter hiemivivus]TCC96309.1 RagB/SusD family nutrient uptake outer membrane protein [Pedobacter hiemivivus]